jgi:hypothetical protein
LHTAGKKPGAATVQGATVRSRRSTMSDEKRADEPGEDADAEKVLDPDDVQAHRVEKEPADDVQAHRVEKSPAERVEKRVEK